MTRRILALFGLLALVVGPAAADSKPDREPDAPRAETKDEPEKSKAGEERPDEAPSAKSSTKAEPANRKARDTTPIRKTGPNKLFATRIDTPCGRQLHLNGWGLCEWGVFSWDLYYAALHCETKSKSGSKLCSLDQGYRIHLHFLRDLSRSQMRKAYRVSVEANAAKELPRFRKRLDQLVGMMRAVEEGDDLTFTYLPGKGMTVAFDGKAAGTIEGADWARLFLRLYVGSKPPTEDLRRGLLGR